MRITRSLWLAVAASSLLALGSIAAASAGPMYPIASANVYSVPPGRSDANMRWAAARTERDIDFLQQDQRDYDGHRANAVADLQAARAQIGLGLAYDAGSESKIAALKAAMNRIAPGLRGDCGSDSNLKNVRRDVEQTIDVLQRDNTDYGGHRIAAVGDLQQARQQIVAALIYDATH